MVWPMVSVIWINYNSKSIMNIVRKSLLALGSLDYPHYEIIIVDNGSTDGSYEEIRKIVERFSVPKKVIRLQKNLGFTGGVNVAYRARSKESKYIVLLNNDAIPLQESLRELVECIEHYDAGAAQGIIVDLEKKVIDTAGDMLSEFLVAYQAFHYRDPRDVRYAFKVSYADGAYSIYRVSAVKNAVGDSSRMFYDEMFAYFDDSVLGLQLWNKGYLVVSCPVITSLHRRSSTFNINYHIKLYHKTKGYYALNELSNSRYKSLIKAMILRQLATSVPIYLFASRRISKRFRQRALFARRSLSAVLRGYIDGVRWARRKLVELGRPLDIYKAPLIPLGTHEVFFMFLSGIGIDYLRRAYTERINKRFERFIERYRL